MEHFGRKKIVPRDYKNLIPFFIFFFKIEKKKCKQFTYFVYSVSYPRKCTEYKFDKQIRTKNVI